MIHRSVDWRLLKAFKDFGILEIVKKGTAWVKGTKPKAGTYRWALPMPDDRDARNADGRPGQGGQAGRNQAPALLANGTTLAASADGTTANHSVASALLTSSR